MFAFLLANHIAGMTRGAFVDDAGRLARDMRSYLVVAQLLNKFLAVIPYVGTQGDPVLSSDLFNHGHGGLRRGAAPRHPQHSLGRQTLCVLPPPYVPYAGAWPFSPRHLPR